MVLKVTHLKGSGRGVSKYLETGLDQSDEAAEYFHAGNAPTQWMGALAEELGLTGEVNADVLSAALDGTLPSGETLPKLHNSRRIGEDLTFSAPKSASIAALAWGDDRILMAFDAAVLETMEWVQKEMIYARHGKSGVDREYGPKVMIAIHRHIDARPVTLENGETFIAPQLHAHCITPNICRRKDGTLGGLKIDMGEMSGLRLMADALFQANFAAKLRKANIPLRETNNGFELADITDAMIAEWSPRKAQIDQQLAAQGLSRKSSTEAQRQAANLKTREAKSTNMTPAQLRKEWAARAAATRPDTYSQPSSDVTPVTVTVQNAIDDVQERLAVIPTALLHAKATFAGCAHHTAQEIGQALQHNADLIRLDDGQRMTTTGAVRDEAYIQAIGQPASTMPALMGADAVPSWLAYREQQQGFSYSPDQRRALAFLATDKNKVSLAVGSAGAGKTTAMSAIAQIASHQYELIGLAPSHAAAQALRDAVGSNVQTVAKWISNPMQGANPPKARRYIILDEAGMVGTHDMAAVLRSLGPQDRLLLVGDPRQLGPIAAGQPYADLLEEYPHATIEQIRRQADEEQRNMVSAFARGDARAGADALMGYVTETEDYADTIEQAATAYVFSRDTGSVVALASRRQSVADLSAAIRQKMQDAGQISPDIAAIDTTQKVQMTKAAMRRKPTYSKGTRIKNPRGKIFKVEAAPVVLDGQAIVTVTDDTGKRQAVKLDDLADDGWQVITLETLAIAQGDQLLVTDTVHAQKANGERITLRNGQALTVTVQGVTQDQRIAAQTPDGQSIILDAQQALPLAYGWARTIHKSQGQTVDHAIVLDDGFNGGQLGYVAASRQRQSIQVFSPDADDLANRLSVWATKSSALNHTPVDTDRYAAAKAQGEADARYTVAFAYKSAPESAFKNKHPEHVGRMGL